MYWSLVVVHILILTVISLNTFPIDLKEIEMDDLHLVDIERKGRFIAVNQTTFLPNLPDGLTREKKASKLSIKKQFEDSGAMVNEVQETIKTDDVNQLTLNQQKPSDWNSMMTRNDSVYVDYPVRDSKLQTFDYSSLIEDHFRDLGSQRPDLTNPAIELVTEECSNIDPFVKPFSTYFYCVESFIVPVENSVC